MLERMGKKAHLSTMTADFGRGRYRQGRLGEAERLSAWSEELGASDDRYNEARPVKDAAPRQREKGWQVTDPKGKP